MTNDAQHMVAEEPKHPNDALHTNPQQDPTNGPMQELMAQLANAHNLLRNYSDQLEASRKDREQLTQALRTAQPYNEPKKVVLKLLKDKLTQFSGSDRRPQTIRAFLSQFEQYAQLAGLDEQSQGIAITALLTGDARCWYETLEPIQNYSQFKDQFLARWTDPQEEDKARDALARLKQTGSARRYTEEFRRLVALLSDLSPREQFAHYKRGLHPQLQRDLFVANVTDLDTAILKVEALDEIDFHSGAKNQRGRSKPSSQHDTAPMDLGAITTTPVTEDNYHDFKQFPKITPHLREFLAQKRACFYCRTPDANHVAADCPKKTKN